MESRKRIELDENTIRVEGSGVKLGPVMLDLPEGFMAVGFDAITVSCAVIEHETAGKLVVIISSASDGFGEFATLTHFNADEARKFAGSIMKAADQCDGVEEAD